ncbi:uncharacterized protein LOC143196678 [Rhynchophorus ferrugineus]|uniref:uncharacterized protein LOC143196678 n=1 Tax=Rhynchophorus ferrugineus TaxID=354439 RepID=UPI003FCD3002
MASARISIGVLLVLLTVLCAQCQDDLQRDIDEYDRKENQTHLSRKRRYLVFPAGSSFQVVFCLTYPSVAVGSIFVFGNTAALAWELPSEPLFYDKKDLDRKEAEAEAQTTTVAVPHDIDLSQFVDHHHDSWNGKLEKIDKYSAWNDNIRQPIQTYRNPFMNFMRKQSPSLEWFNPNPSKNHLVRPSNVRTFGRPDMKRFQKTRQQESFINPVYYHVHRRTRRDLYGKLETFLSSLSIDGRSCLLKAICSITKMSRKEKGTFIEEILKVIFKSKPHDDYPNEDLYDHAADPNHNCDDLYPSCQGPAWNSLFSMNK